MARRTIEAARGTVGVVKKQPAMGIKISILAKRIAGLQSTILELEGQITTLFNGLPCKPQGFPLGRTHTLAAIVSEIGDIHRFATLKKFLSHLGWCPQSFQTGNFWLEHPKMSHAGNKYIRRLVWMLSILAIRMVPNCREYFERRVMEGKAKMHILVAVVASCYRRFTLYSRKAYLTIRTGRTIAASPRLCLDNQYSNHSVMFNESRSPVREEHPHSVYGAS